MQKTIYFQKGQLLVELLVAIGLSAILLPAITSGFLSSQDGKAQAKQRTDAILLLKEAEEAARNIRDSGWTSLTAYGNGTFHPIVSGSIWTLASGSETTAAGYTRQIVLSNVSRDASGAIVTSGGTLDPSTKKLVSTISWTQPYSSSVTSTLYLTRWQENAAYTETTQAQFNAGTKTGVTVRATNPPLVADDGEVILGAGGHSDWCTPTLSSTSLNLAGNGEAKSIYAIEGTAIVGTGQNASGLPLVKITLGSTPPYPPTAAVAGTSTLNYKTNALVINGNYAYIATTNNAQEIVIIDISGAPPYNTVSGFFNAPGNGAGNSVYILGNVGYMTSGNRFYTFDLSSKSGARPQLGAVTLPGIGRKIMVVGNYAYIAIDGVPNIHLQIVDVSNPSALSLKGTADVDGSGGVDVYVNATGNRAYLVGHQSASEREFFIINTTTKTGSLPQIGTYEANGMDPKGITVVPGNRVIIVGSGGEQYQVLKIDDETNPVRCGGLTTSFDINAVSSVIESDGDVYSYVVTSENNREFSIVEGGPGGGFATNGTFESQTFNPGYQTANNRFAATFDQPAGTSVQVQVSMTNLVGGVCPTTGNYTFVGFDGLTSTKSPIVSSNSYTFPFATIPPNYTNPGQCIRYKLYLNGDGINTPVIKDVTINYSP